MNISGILFLIRSAKLSSKIVMEVDNKYIWKREQYEKQQLKNEKKRQKSSKWGGEMKESYSIITKY